MRLKDKKNIADLMLEAFGRAFPEASCSLDQDAPERLAVRGILSAQCTDVRVNIVSKELFEKYPTMAAIDEAPEKDIMDIIRPCGLYKAKAASIKAFAHLYEGQWGGEVPRDTDSLMKCPGVGKKIANLIVGEVYGIPAVVVDTHCKRVMYRTGITDSKDPLAVEKDIMKVFPEDSWISLGHEAVELGRTYCRARAPLCGECPLSSFCARRTGD